MKNAWNKLDKETQAKIIDGGLPCDYVYLLSPLFWQSLGKALEWNDVPLIQMKRWCHISDIGKEYGYTEMRDGIIVGESRDKESWWVQWSGIDSRYSYEKRFIKEEIRINWKTEWHRFIDHLAEGKDANSFFDNLIK